jgi:hypothetical protein
LDNQVVTWFSLLQATAHPRWGVFQQPCGTEAAMRRYLDGWTTSSTFAWPKEPTRSLPTSAAYFRLNALDSFLVDFAHPESAKARLVEIALPEVRRDRERITDCGARRIALESASETGTAHGPSRDGAVRESRIPYMPR